MRTLLNSGMFQEVQIQRAHLSDGLWQPEITTPNPFNPETWIPYDLAQSADVMLAIYDTNGMTVRTINAGHQPAGIYQSKPRAIYWNGRDERGRSVASGVYFYQLTAGGFSQTRRMVIVK